MPLLDEWSLEENEMVCQKQQNTRHIGVCKRGGEVEREMAAYKAVLD